MERERYICIYRERYIEREGGACSNPWPTYLTFYDLKKHLKPLPFFYEATFRSIRFSPSHTDYNPPRSEMRRSLLNPSQMSTDACHWFWHVCQTPSKL